MRLSKVQKTQRLAHASRWVIHRHLWLAFLLYRMLCGDTKKSRGRDQNGPNVCPMKDPRVKPAKIAAGNSNRSQLMSISKPSALYPSSIVCISSAHTSVLDQHYSSIGAEIGRNRPPYLQRHRKRSFINPNIINPSTRNRPICISTFNQLSLGGLPVTAS